MDIPVVLACQFWGCKKFEPQRTPPFQLLSSDNLFAPMQFLDHTAHYNYSQHFKHFSFKYNHPLQKNMEKKSTIYSQCVIQIYNQLDPGTTIRFPNVSTASSSASDIFGQGFPRLPWGFFGDFFDVKTKKWTKCIQIRCWFYASKIHENPNSSANANGRLGFRMMVLMLGLQNPLYKSNASNGRFTQCRGAHNWIQWYKVGPYTSYL